MGLREAGSPEMSTLETPVSSVPDRDCTENISLKVSHILFLAVILNPEIGISALNTRDSSQIIQGQND